MIKIIVVLFIIFFILIIVLVYLLAFSVIKKKDKMSYIVFKAIMGVSLGLISLLIFVIIYNLINQYL